MVFLEDFLEMLDELPLELKERCAELRRIDAQVQAGAERRGKSLAEFFSRAPGMSTEQRQKEYQIFALEFGRQKELAQRKIDIAEKMQELVEKYCAHLEKEKALFKMELESDNPGITQQIEKRFSSYVESVIALRKEQRKRKVALSNGTSVPPLKISRVDSGATLRGMSSEYSAAEVEEELFNDVWDNKPKSRRGSLYNEETGTPARQRKNPAKNSLSTPSFIGQAVSPAASEKSWTPFAPGTPHDSSPAPSFTATVVSPTIAMPNFSGPESRHGRPRKFTSRVQEFKDTLMRQRSQHHPPVGTEGEEEGSGSSEDDDEEAKRTWCICKEKSYGNMVACDNDKCPYEWFHYHCVGITAPPRGKWYCPHCSEQMKAPSHGLDLNF